MTGREGSPPGDRVPVADMSYTEASRELDEIVAFFEQRDVDVDQLVSRLERASAIVEELDRRIRQTRMQVEELVPRLEAAARAERAVEQGAAPPAGEDRELERVEGEDVDEAVGGLLDEELAEEHLDDWDDDGGIDDDDSGPGNDQAMF